MIDANSLGTRQNPGSPSGRLERFPVAGVFGQRLSPWPGLRNSGSLLPASLVTRLPRCLPDGGSFLEVEVLAPVAPSLACPAGARDLGRRQLLGFFYRRTQRHRQKGKQRGAVGTIIADRPPHRSVRAALPHTALTLDMASARTPDFGGPLAHRN